jgi:hypothetical protein
LWPACCRGFSVLPGVWFAPSCTINLHSSRLDCRPGGFPGVPAGPACARPVRPALRYCSGRTRLPQTPGLCCWGL